MNLDSTSFLTPPARAGHACGKRGAVAVEVGHKGKRTPERPQLRLPRGLWLLLPSKTPPAGTPRCHPLSAAASHQGKKRSRQPSATALQCVFLNNFFMFKEVEHTVF